MADKHLGHDEFFARLTELFNGRQGKDHGSIQLTQKRLSHDAPIPEDDPLGDLHPDSPLPVLVRATNGKSKKSKSPKVKLSTVVQPDDVDAFFIRYADVCKAGMLGLKKRERKGRKKDKGKKKRPAPEA